MSIYYIEFATLNSTHLWAKEHLQELDPNIVTCITANEQTAGIGQHGRTWHSPPNVNLYASYCFPLPGTNTNLPHLAQIGSLAIANILIEQFSLSPRLKWPNDILLNGKKCGGVLCDIKDTYAILSIGLNVNMGKTELKTIDQPATSLLIELEKNIEIPKVLKTHISPKIVQLVEQYILNGFDPFEKLYKALKLEST